VKTNHTGAQPDNEYDVPVPVTRHIPPYSSCHGTTEQLGAVIVMVGTIARTGFLQHWQWA
jgi:hypothetical protein